MIYLLLFLAFLKIGAFTFGGGYAMIPLIREAVLSNGWMDESEFLSFIAVAESTPGPIAVNMATFVGSSQGGLFGAFCATLGVVLPSFLILLFIASCMKNLLRYKPVKAFLAGVRPCVIGMIFATALTFALHTFFGIAVWGDGFSPDIKSLLIFAILLLLGFLFSHFKKKAPSPIFMLLLSAGLGIVFFRG